MNTSKDKDYRRCKYVNTVDDIVFTSTREQKNYKMKTYEVNVDKLVLNEDETAVQFVLILQHTSTAICNEGKGRSKQTCWYYLQNKMANLLMTNDLSSYVH